MKRERKETRHAAILAMAFISMFGFTAMAMAQKSIELSDEQVENIVRRSYQYVAMYNVNNKFAIKQGGWNTVDADTKLKDHTMREIARPNNDTLYICALLDLRKDPVILEMPAFDSKYVSLMVTGYDHYVNVPMTTRLGDFKKPEKMLFYTERTEGYNGEPVEGVDRIFGATGDFISAVLRIMPHANEPERFNRILEQMKAVKIMTLSEFRGGKAKPIDDIEFPSVGKTDADVYENNLLEVMQFVFNHTTFDPKDKLDQAVLAAFKPLGIEPGKSFDPNTVANIDGKRFREAAQKVQKAEFARSQDPAVMKEHGMGLFQPKGQIPFHLLVLQSVTGPIGLPAAEAMYPPVVSKDGQPMNAQHDYVIRMSKAELPPAGAFWSLTLYDMQNGFFIPNDRKKYSVGENAGMKMNDDGGIEIYVAAEKPEGVPEENWLPISRKDENMDIVLRVYVPDLEKMKTWEAPKAEKVTTSQAGAAAPENGRPGAAPAVALDAAQIENLVRRTYQYVAMFNVINKGTMMEENPTRTDWNGTFAATGLQDHTAKSIARPNNDTLYISTALDLRSEPIIVSYPAFDSKFVALEISAYDHYVDIPLTTTKGDFKEPTKVLYYTKRSQVYDGGPVEGVDKIIEMTGDFAVAFLRVMPHAAEPERLEKNLAAMKEVKAVTLSEHLGQQPKPVRKAQFPAFQPSDADIYEKNFAEVMQFVVNHTTFDPDDEMDAAVLAALKPLGIEPGKAFDPQSAKAVDGKALAEAARKVHQEALEMWVSPEGKAMLNDLFLPKGEMTLEAMVLQSAYGPIGLPAHQAVYPGIASADGQPLNAQHDYVIRMSKDEMPPSTAFWSVTLYDAKNGFFIPNDRKKYSVGENAGFQLDEDGGIEIHVAAEKPEGVPEENWLPINRGDEALDLVMRIYAPDVERMKTWTPPKAENYKTGAGKVTGQAAGRAEILQSWQGDFPVAQLKNLPEGQRDKAVGYIGDVGTFEGIWRAFKPGEEVPEVDFVANLVLFARNTRFYNSTRIGQVNLKGGVAEVLAMETMSAMPIEDKAAMSLAVVPRKGITGIQAGDDVVPVKDNR